MIQFLEVRHQNSLLFARHTRPNSEPWHDEVTVMMCRPMCNIIGDLDFGLKWIGDLFVCRFEFTFFLFNQFQSVKFA